MTLSFSTHFQDGTPTYFPEKILAALPYRDSKLTIWDMLRKDGRLRSSWESPAYKPWYPMEPVPKLHTLREDKADRWKPGMPIHFVLFNRTPHRWQFAYAHCKGVQKVKIQAFGPTILVEIEGRILHPKEVDLLALNDGFPNKAAFFDYFVPNINHVWNGKLIHWTDLKY